MAFFLLLRATPDIPGGDDGYRHVKFAYRLIRGQGVLARPWHLLYFWPRPTDGWFGYHLLLAPFTLVFELITAAKVCAAVVYGALAFVLLALLKELGAVSRKVWVLLALTGSGMTLYRSTFTRPFLLSILLVLAALYFTLRGNPTGVALMSAAHALCYSVFFLAGFAPGLYFILRRNRMAAKLVAGSLIGMALGLAASPFFPENVRYDVAQTIQPLTHRPAQDLIMELRPLNWEWINPARVVLAVWLLALLIAFIERRQQKISGRASLLLAMCLAALAGSLRVGRMFDIFVPLAVLFSAVVVSPWILKNRRHRTDAAAAATVLLVLCWFNVAGACRAVRQAPSVDRFRGVSQYLLANRPGTVVFNAQWEHYQFLYFWNSQNTYVVGIDPSFMQYQDERRYWLWRHIANDEPATCGRPQCGSGDSRSIPSAIAGEFGTFFVVVEHQSNPRLEQILEAALAKEIYRDTACSLYSLPDPGTGTASRGAPH